MKFHELTSYWQKLEGVSSRLAITEVLAEMLEKLEIEETVEAVYLSLGQLGPKYAMVEFGMAEKMVARAIGEAYGVETEDVWKTYKEVGDMGDTISKLQITNSKLQSPISKLTIVDVYGRLMAIAKEGGAGSQERKVAGLAELLKSLSLESAKYAVRIPVGNLRLGFSDMTVLDALSWMVAGDKSLRVSLEGAFNVAADVGIIAKEIKDQVAKIKVMDSSDQHTPGPSREGNVEAVNLRLQNVKDALENITVKLGTPVVPALCQRLDTFDEVIEKIGEVACEPKYDGTRLQIHWRRNVEKKERMLKSRSKASSNSGQHTPLSRAEDPSREGNDGWNLRSFTRNLEENSAMFLELDKLGDHLLADEVILDGEAVGWDAENEKWLPFQVTMTRKRKHGMADQLLKVPLRYMMFDVLYWKKSAKVPAELKDLPDGDVHELPFVERRKILEKIILQKGLMEPTPIEVTKDPVELREWHMHYLKQGLEGVVIKRWHGPYVPSRKGWNWVKMKEVESAAAGLADTLDCVVMGYYRGRGKRADFGLGAFLVGVIRKDDADSTFVFNGKQSDAKENFQITNSKFQTNSNDQILNSKHNYEKQLEVRILTVTKIGTGLSDEQFRELHKRLEPLRVVEMPENYEVSKFLEPDVWVKPDVVVEIAADNITKSPNHTAGLALRFPRLVKFRDDKNWEDASTVEEVEGLYGMQGGMGDI